MITADQVNNAAKCAVKEEDRTRDIVIFSVQENKKEIDVRISEICECLDDNPRISEYITALELEG